MQIPEIHHPSKSKYLVFTADYIIPFFVILCVLCISYLAIYSNYFKISQVDCQLDFEPCTGPNLLVELDTLKGQNIFLYDHTFLEKRLMSGDFTIREIKTRKELPNKLSVELHSVYPSLAIQIAGDSSWVVLDEEYRVIATRTLDPNVPTILINQPLTIVVGKIISDPQIQSVLSFTSDLYKELSSLKTVSLIEPSIIEIQLNSGEKAIFTSKKNVYDQLKLLQAILSDDTIRKGAQIIDVRFSQPVLR